MARCARHRCWTDATFKGIIGCQMKYVNGACKRRHKHTMKAKMRMRMRKCPGSRQQQ